MLGIVTEILFIAQRKKIAVKARPAGEHPNKLNKESITRGIPKYLRVGNRGLYKWPRGY